MSICPSTPEAFIEAWQIMNEEMLEEGTPVIIKIPTIEKTQDWMNRNSNA